MPVYRSHHVQAISFYRPDTGETAQFNLIEGATFEVVSKPLMQVIQAGKKITVQELVTLKVTVFDFAFIDMLTTWQDNYIPVQAVAAGSPNLQWYESGYLRITSEMKASEGLTKLTLELEAVQVLNNKNIHMNENLLAYKSWSDSDLNGLADAYSTRLEGDAVAISTFSAGIQTLNVTTAGTNTSIRITLIFPISGVSLKMSYFRANTEAALERLDMLDFAGTLRVFGVTAVTTSTGIKSARIVSDSLCYGISCDFVRMFSVANNRQFSYPALTTNGSLTPGTKFMNW